MLNDGTDFILDKLGEVLDCLNDLKCCGNCMYFYIRCGKSKQEKDAHELAFKYCHNWEYDGLKRVYRLIQED